MANVFDELAKLRVPKVGDADGVTRFLWEFQRICQRFSGIEVTDLDDIPDGTSYHKPSILALDASGYVDLSKAGVVSRTLANIADSGDDTRKAVPLNSHTGAGRAYSALDSNNKLSTGTANRTVAQFETTIGTDGHPNLTSKTQDHLADGSTNVTLKLAARTQYFRSMPSMGANICPNGGFEAGPDWWTTGSGFSVITDAAKARSGNKYGQLTAGANVQANAYMADDINTQRAFPIRAGDIFWFKGYGYIETAGEATTLYFAIYWYDKDGAYISATLAG